MVCLKKLPQLLDIKRLVAFRPSTHSVSSSEFLSSITDYRHPSPTSLSHRLNLRITITMSMNHITAAHLRSSLSQDAGRHAAPQEVVSPRQDDSSQHGSDSELPAYSKSEAEQRSLDHQLRAETSRTVKLRAQLANVARIMSYGKAPGKF